jgi:hypothetical protein
MYAPMIESDNVEEDIYEIDEMFLGAKQKGKHGRKPSNNHLVFGNFPIFISM